MTTATQYAKMKANAEKYNKEKERLNEFMKNKYRTNEEYKQKVLDYQRKRTEEKKKAKLNTI